MLLTKQLLALRPNKSDWIFAIKTFFAGILALYIAISLDLAYPIWAMGTVFVIANPYTGMTASKSLYRFLGTALGAIVTIIVTPILIHTPWIFTLFLATWVGVCLYISLLDRTPRSYMFILAGYTTVIISFTIINNIDTATVFDLAIGRFIEISLGVVCSAIVMTTFFPMNIGPVIETQVSKILKDTQDVFDNLLTDHNDSENYTQILNNITRDIANIHVMAIHLSFERSKLKGMTKPLQEMLHQLSMVVANLVAMAERIKQLDQFDPGYRSQLEHNHQHIIDFLEHQPTHLRQEINLLPEDFEHDFAQLHDIATEEQQILIASLKMDIRHFIQNIRVIHLIWDRIQQGDYTLPESVIPITTDYPNLHLDHGVAVRGGISAFIVVMISTGIWILSGWKAGYIMAEMAAITACILTAMDNPVPALRLFIRGNLYAIIVIFVYAFGIFPMVTEFWQLAIALAPFIIFCLLLYPHPPLTALALPMIMGMIMGLNLHNRYVIDPVAFMDNSMGTVIGPIISVLVIQLVRSMSPDITAQRILALHYNSIRKALYIPYGVQFRIHLRGMLDRIGVLNTKSVQSNTLKNSINLAIIECSAVVDLTRIRELMFRFNNNDRILIGLEDFIIQLDDYFRSKELNQDHELLRLKIIESIATLYLATVSIKDSNISERLQISLNNIQSSLCHRDLVQPS